MQEADIGDGEFDIAILTNMMHLFDPNTNQTLLRKVGARLGADCPVVVIDVVPDDARCSATHALMFGMEMVLNSARSALHRSGNQPLAVRNRLREDLQSPDHGLLNRDHRQQGASGPALIVPSPCSPGAKRRIQVAT